MSIADCCGWFTTVVFSISFVPQIWRTFKVKKVNQVSLWTWITTTAGYMTALVYGISLREAILIVGYGWGLTCSVVYLLLYFRYNKRKVSRKKRGKYRVANHT